MAGSTEYVKAISEVLGHGDATEHSYRPALKAWIESFGENISATNEPKRAEHNAPDFDVKVLRGHGWLSVGKFEAKDVGTDLIGIEKDSSREKPRSRDGLQLKRYRRAFANLIFTNHVEFRWYQKGELKLAVSLGAVTGSDVDVSAEGVEKCEALMAAFIAQSPIKISSARALAERMAALSAIIQDVLFRSLEAETASDITVGLKTAFADTLVPDLSDEQFADMLAQTIAYGLFAARVQHTTKAVFTRQSAGATVPKSNPFVRGLFSLITSSALDDESYAGVVDDLAQLLNDADIVKILKNFGQERRDPIVHFYETFLSAYNPSLRDIRGVYYTPLPVVDYIVKSVDLVLKQTFGLADGIADTTKTDAGDHKVLLLDPATGTGTFLYAAIARIRQRFIDAGRTSLWSAYVRQHLLPRLYGFELIVAPYAIAHIKIALELAAMDLPQEERGDLAFEFEGEERVGVFLTNTLDPGEAHATLALGKFISDEANAASVVKTDKPIMVVFGNPPYQGQSANASTRREFSRKVKGKDHYRTVKTAIGASLEAYYKVGGQPLGETNSKWLQDDYVKFIRFGQARIEQTGAGILAYVTNHTFLDAPTFRGMRDSLLATFDDIYVFDLHGSTRRREKNPSGGVDENVFDQIQQGVCVTVFVKSEGGSERARIHYAEIWGARRDKYEYLEASSLLDDNWRSFEPAEPFFSFRPADVDIRTEWESGISLPEVFPVFSTGIVTHRDVFATDPRLDRLKSRLSDFTNPQKTDSEIRTKYFGTKGRRTPTGITYLPGDNRDWTMSSRRASLMKDSNPIQSIQPFTHRPFDNRFVVYNKDVIDGMKHDVMRHMLFKGNLGMLSARSNKSPVQDQFFVTDRMSEVKAGESTTGSVLFPLWLHPDHQIDEGEPATLAGLGLRGADQVRANISSLARERFEKKLGLPFREDPTGGRAASIGPRDIFDYIYGITHSSTYRSRFSDFLREDYPRVPIVDDPEVFWAIVDLGNELVELHTLKLRPKSGPATAPNSGTGRIEKIPLSKRWEESDNGGGHILLNLDGARDGSAQLMAGISRNVWEHRIGGHQVLHKWLDARVGLTLDYDEIVHLVDTVNAIHRTLEIVAEIDLALPVWPLVAIDGVPEEGLSDAS